MAKEKKKLPLAAYIFAGLVLGIVGVTASVTAVILSACGMYQARLCKKCKKGAEFR